MSGLLRRCRALLPRPIAILGAEQGAEQLARFTANYAPPSPSAPAKMATHAAGSASAAQLPWLTRQLRGLYFVGVHHPNRLVRLVARSTIGKLLAISCWRLHSRWACGGAPACP